MIDFSSALKDKMTQKGLHYEIRGLLTSDDIVYPFGTDTKVLSTVFELLVRPLIFEIVKEHSLLVREPEKQNFYPDFTLMHDEADRRKIAVDVKTTYRDFVSGGRWTASFTLGSYTSFLRNGTKNIVFPYSHYAKHYIIGFIYTRRSPTLEHLYPLDQRASVGSPFSDVEWFVQEKYRIAGERAGSGNTTNIGSITGSSVEDFALGNGPFTEAGEAIFLDYWRNYGRTRVTRAYSNLVKYYEWINSNR